MHSGNSDENMIVDNGQFFSQVTRLLKSGHTVTIPVKGCSMLPFIRGDRDAVVLEGIESGTPEGRKRIEAKVGDIVLFFCDGRHIMHRIIATDGNRLRIQGDGITVGEEHCLRNDLCGKVVTILRRKSMRIDPYSPRMMRRLAVWNALKPVRRYLLAIIRRLPIS